MKKVLKIVLKVFAWLIAAIIFFLVAFVIWFRTTGVTVALNDEGSYRLVRFKTRVDTLRASGPYVADTATLGMKLTIDTLRAVEIREYFQLDTLYSPNDDTWTKALAIGKFVATNIPHDNQKEDPKYKNAIGLWEYTKTVAPAFNCRLHSILTFELLSSVGIKARYITCLPQDSIDRDCHVVNEVWLPEKNKWVMLDTDMGGHYVTDKSGNLLSLKEMREHYIAGKKMVMYPGFEKGSSRKTYYYAYMAKNTYWFTCWGNLGFYQEDYTTYPELESREHHYALVPSGFKPFSRRKTTAATSDEKQFWEMAE